MKISWEGSFPYAALALLVLAFVAAGFTLRQRAQRAQ